MAARQGQGGASANSHGIATRQRKYPILIEPADTGEAKAEVADLVRRICEISGHLQLRGNGSYVLAKLTEVDRGALHLKIRAEAQRLALKSEQPQMPTAQIL